MRLLEMNTMLQALARSHSKAIFTFTFSASVVFIICDMLTQSKYTKLSSLFACNIRKHLQAPK